jgi:serine protease Do
MARDVMTQLAEHGRVVRGWLGVVIQPVTPALAESLDIDKARGAIVSDVAPDSPAGEAGVKRGDVIVEVDDQPIEDARALQLRVARSSPGDEVDLAVIRDGERRSFSVELGEAKADERIAAGELPVRGELGLSVQPLTDQIAGQLGLKDVDGVVVTAVEPDSPAAQAGLRRGDVIEEVARNPVASVSQFKSALSKAGDVVLLLVNRSGSSMFVPVERS